VQNTQKQESAAWDGRVFSKRTDSCCSGASEKRVEIH